RMYTAASPQGPSFNLLHVKCGNRIRYQNYCPVCNEVVQRGDLVKGYEVAKDEYVRFTDEELKALEGEASSTIDIAQFAPLAKVDPVDFEKSCLLGPDRGGEKAYRLLADALAQSGRVALATFVMRGKENLVLVRPADGGLLLHAMYFADELRDFGEVDKGGSARTADAQLKVALRLIDELSHADFKPEQYDDAYRRRVLEAVEKKAQGRQIAVAAPRARGGEVVDLMEALKQSLGKRGEGGRRRPPEEPEAAPGRRELAKAPKRTGAGERSARRAQAGKR